MAWLDKQGINYDYRDIRTNNPTVHELTDWHKKSGLPASKFFGVNSSAYKALGLGRKMNDMDDEEKIEILSSDGMLIKRPIVVGDDFVLVGFKEAEWSEKLLN